MSSEKPIDGRCGAKKAKSNPPVYCTNRPVRGRKRCRKHGGASPPAGPEHHRYKHGRHSKTLPKEFHTRIGKILADGDLRKIGRDLAVTTLLVEDALVDYANATTPENRAKASARVADLQETRDALLNGEVRRYAQMRDTMRVPEVMTMLGAMAAAVRTTALRWQGDGKMQDVEGYLAVVDDQFRRLRAGSVRALALTVKAEEGVTA